MQNSSKSALEKFHDEHRCRASSRDRQPLTSQTVDEYLAIECDGAVLNLPRDSVELPSSGRRAQQSLLRSMFSRKGVFRASAAVLVFSLLGWGYGSVKDAEAEAQEEMSRNRKEILAQVADDMRSAAQIWYALRDADELQSFGIVILEAIHSAKSGTLPDEYAETLMNDINKVLLEIDTEAVEAEMGMSGSGDHSDDMHETNETDND